MSEIQEILGSGRKPKEIVQSLADRLRGDENLIEELIRCFNSGSSSVKGHCMEAIEHVTKENPEFVHRCFDFVIEHLNDKLPRVKWEACRIIGNVARTFPDRVERTILLIMENTKDKGTVVRWSAAFALTEIARSNPDLRRRLLPEFRRISSEESNKGVKNIYQKFLKEFEE